MIPEELERLAREAGFDKWTPAELVGKSAMDRIAVVGEYPCGELLARFAALVRAQALEQAAQECEVIASDCDSWDAGGNDGRIAARLCESAIRALKEQP